MATLGFSGAPPADGDGCPGAAPPVTSGAAGLATAYVEYGVENPAHHRLMFGPELAERGRHPTLDAAADAAFAELTGALVRGQAAGEVPLGAVPEQARTAWSLVHGLTTLLIDGRLTFLGVSTAQAERHARLACVALMEGLEATQA